MEFKRKTVGLRLGERGLGNRKKRKRVSPIVLRRLLRMELLEDRRLLAIDTFQWLPAGPDAIVGSVNSQALAPPVPGGQDFQQAVSGAINVARPRPGDANTIFVGTVNGGIWRTQNSQVENWNGLPGPTWTNLTPIENSLSIADLEFDPSSLADIPTAASAATERLVAGIGTTSAFKREGGQLLGLLFSNNGGATWQTENADGALLGRQVNAVLRLGNEVLVGLDDGTAATGLGLARVSLVAADPNPFIPAVQFDNGNGLKLTRTGRVADLIRDPQNPLIVFAALPDANRDAAGVTINESGVYRSVDGGQTWTKISTAIVNDKLFGQAPDGSAGKIGRAHV